MLTTPHDLADPPMLAEGLPADAVIERLPLGAAGMLELAILARDAADADDVAAHDAEMADLVARTTAWATGRDAHPPTVVPLYGLHVVWTQRRAAIIGPADRLPQMRAAVVEFAGHDAELRDIESRVAETLAHVDADAPLAFQFDERSLPRRGELAARFGQSVSLRRRLALLAPAVQRPAPQPPTLSGQLGERLRDRTRIVERLESAVDQADLLERVYTGCGDRASECATSRRHATLEWVLIVLLAAEVILLTVDLLAARAT
ncbi:MAG: hypothetical protein K8S94_14500 [Planctomycetia bacterium]|nr:hypothetical protein [Planctomycetia bacterium]